MTDPLLAKRKEVVTLWNADTPVMKIVEATGLSWAAVKRTIKAYQTGGIEALTSMRGRPMGTGRFLSPQHEERIKNILYTKQPREVGINRLTEIRDINSEDSIHRLTIVHAEAPQYLWCRDSVRELVHQISGIELSSQLVNTYLHRWGFPKTKQNQRPMARCSEAIQDWLRNHPDVNTTYWLYRQRLDTKEKQSKISATDNHRKEFWTVIQGNFSQEKQMAFLNQLRKQTREPITVVRHDYNHYTKEQVSQWLITTDTKLLPPLLDSERQRLKDDFEREIRAREEIQNEALAPLGITVRYIYTEDVPDQGDSSDVTAPIDRPKKPAKPVKLDF